MSKNLTLLLVLSINIVLAGCGAKGDLYLPETSVDQQNNGVQENSKQDSKARKSKEPASNVTVQ